MALELIAENGEQGQHRPWLQKLRDKSSGAIRIASAYVADDRMLLGIDNRKIHLLTSFDRMDIISGATKIRCLRSLIESGVQIKCLRGGPRLHSKVYIFGDDLAVATSANLTTSGLDRNIEVGVQFTGDSVRELISWFDGFWSAAHTLHDTDLSELEAQTNALRHLYAALRRQTAAKPALPLEAAPSVRSKSELRNLLKHAPGYFVCNTNRRNSPDGEDEDLMRDTMCAAAWAKFNYPSHMERVGPGAPIFMFAKGIGIIGVGRARTSREVLRPGNPNRITSRYRKDEEWRVPIDNWIAWSDHEHDAYEWTMPNATFLDVSDESYLYLREGVLDHFLRGA